MPIILLWIIFALIVASSAKRRGRSFLIWFILSCLIYPLIAWLLLKAISER